MKFDLVANRKFLYLIRGGLFVLSLVLLAIPPALRPGIEFTAGTTTQIRFKKAVSEQDLRNAYAALGHEEARIQGVSASEYLIRTRELHVPPGSFTSPAAAPDEVRPVGPQPAKAEGKAKANAKANKGQAKANAKAEPKAEPKADSTRRRRMNGKRSGVAIAEAEGGEMNPDAAIKKKARKVSRSPSGGGV